MVFSPVNLSTAKQEALFQRLAWVNATAKDTVVYDALGDCHQISILIQLRGKISFSPQFTAVFMPQDYEQNAEIC